VNPNANAKEPAAMTTRTSILCSLSLALVAGCLGPAGAGPALTVPASGEAVAETPPAATPEGVSEVKSAAIATRAYAGGHTLVSLQGDARQSQVQSFEGGGAFSDVVHEPVGPSHVVKKHIAGVKYEDIALEVGPQAPAILQWIKDSLTHNYSRKDGSIVSADFNYKARAELEFFHALISEVQFPAVDGASREPVFITTKLSPESTRRKPGSGMSQPPSFGKSTKNAMGSNFRFTLSGLEQATTRVNKVEAIVVKQKVVEDNVGEVRDYQREPQSLEVGNVAFTVPEVDAEPFYQWLQTFVIQGQNSDADEKTATLEYLSPDLKAALFTVNLTGCGIFRLSPEKAEAGGENIRRVRVEMYCEEVSFDYLSDKGL
jgi:hypothetical protein